MNQTQTKHLLPFDPIMQVIEDGLAQLAPYVRFHIDTNEYVLYLLEWLSVKIEDEAATSASDLASAYLRRHNVDANFAAQMSHFVLDAILYTVTGAFPNISFRDLSRARYVMEDPFTLAVYIPHHEKAHH